MHRLIPQFLTVAAIPLPVFAGDTASSLGCLPGRRYAVAVTLRNRSAATVTITDVGGAEPAPWIIRRVATQVRVAPPPPTGDVAMIVLRAWVRSCKRTFSWGIATRSDHTTH